MAIIYSYPVVSTVNNSDTLVISVSDTTADNGFLTKSLTADDLASYVTARVNLSTQGDTGSGTINLDTEVFKILGTANEIETKAKPGGNATKNELQIGLPDSVTITSNLTVGNNSTIGGTLNVTGQSTLSSVNVTDLTSGRVVLVGTSGELQDDSDLTFTGTTLTSTNLVVSTDLTVGNDLQINNDAQVDGAATVGGVLTMEDNIDMTLNGNIINLLNPVQAQDAATKAYVDSLVSGGLAFRGSFRADTGEILSGINTGSYLYNCPGGAGTRVAVLTGDYYIVANTGGQFYCSGDLLNVGDSIIAVADAAADSSTVNDWATLESDNVEGTGITNYIPKWTDSQVLGDSMLSQDAGATKVTVTGGVGIDDYISHNNDNNTRFGFPSNDSFTLDTNGTERLKVSSGGNVGINTSTPQRTLDVNGVILSSNRSGQAFRAEPDNGSGFAVTEFFNDNPILRLARNTGQDTVKIQALGDSFFNGGKVSIGTNPGSAQLHAATSGSFPAAKITSTNSGGTGLVVEKTSSGTGDIQRWQYTNNTVKAVVDSEGKFGIGLSNPLFDLDVYGAEGIRTRRSTSADGFALVALNSLTTPTSACGIYYTNNVGALILNDTTQNQNVKIQSLGDSYIKGGRVGIGTDLTTARPGSILFVKDGDVEIERPNVGTDGGRLILQTPNKTANYAISVDNNGDIISTGLQSGSVRPNVTSIIAGTNVTISPASGTGAVTINASGGGGGGGATSLNGLTDVLTTANAAYFLDPPSSSWGSDNIVLGFNAASTEPKDNNIIIGNNGGNVGPNADDAIVIGHNAAQNANSFAGGTRCVVIGNDAMQDINWSVNNTVVGHAAASRGFNGGNGTGYNICIGANSGPGGSGQGATGSANYAIGSGLYNLTSGGNNIGVGNQAGQSVSTGFNNTFVGHFANFPSSGAVGTGDNNTVIGYNAKASSNTVDNEITLGNSSVTVLRCAVTSITSLSDERDKKDITDLQYGLEFIESLQPKQFTWDNRTETFETTDLEGNNITEEVISSNKGKKDFGFIAQDVQALDNDVLRLVYDENPDKLEMSYGKLVPILVKAVKELSDKVKALENA